MVRTHSPARIAAIVAAAGLGIVLIWGAVSHAEPQRTNRAAAEAAVQEALQREMYGLVDERDSLLKAAIDHLPQFAPALWQLGHVKDARNRWLTSGQFIERWTSSSFCVGRGSFFVSSRPPAAAARSSTTLNR